MSPSGDEPAGIITGINVTPLVDITLVLLIIFVVTAKIIVAPAVPLDLPRATQTEAVQVVLSVVVPAQGATLVDGAAMPDRASLTQRARAAQTLDPELRVVVHADGRATHARVMGVLDALKSAGVERIAFAAVPGGAAP